jgi:hypothetical protein
MTVQPRPPIVEIVPESAPFSVEQRMWLNGFFAGALSIDGSGVKPLSAAEAAALLPGGPTAVPASPLADGDDGAPWHDQTMPIAERMTLAEGRPLRRRMMAAMGQQDCGQCGYNCEDYSDAIFLKKEERLNLCVPGGKETARMLKKLYEEISAAPAAKPAIPASAAGFSAVSPIVMPAAAGHSRDHPAEATFLSRTRLNKPGSEKETWHVEFDPTGNELDYAVGDTFGVFPANDPALVDAVIARPKSRRTSRLRAAPCATFCSTAFRWRPRRTCCFSLFPTSPAASGGRRPRHYRPARIRTAMPRRSTCSRRWKSSPASVPIPRPSSRRSTRCSRASIRSPRRPRPSRPPGAHRRCGAPPVNGRRRPASPRPFAERVAPGAKVRAYAEGAKLRAGRRSACPSS